MLLVGVIAIVVNIPNVMDIAREELKRHYRQRLFAELQPAQLANCSLARFGSANDGGYLMCDNLLSSVGSAYSYGIEGRDEWGCAVSEKLHVPVHQYDCFVTTRPQCAGAAFAFHEECIGETRTDPQNRAFDTLANQVAKNDDEGKHLVVKVDVEGAEWGALGAVPGAVLDKVDQLVVEFHGTDQARYVDVLKKLKATFVVANVHFNNVTCHEGVRPFPAWAFEVLFVNGRLAKLAAPGWKRIVPAAAESPNDPTVPDCQGRW